ncbi:MAG: iron-containing alcohol dehydrogenase [Thermoplasmata archaeon]|nr:iron-containing alcohol dehydrogenase [Thermoplasmata archaeon]
MLGYFLAPKIVLGVGAFEQLSSLGAERCWVLVDPTIASSPRARRLLEELGKEAGEVILHPAPPGEPTLASLEPVTASLTAARADWVVAIGGGSVLDLAKAAWLSYERPGEPLETFSGLGALGLRQRAHFAAVPTTCGSGSEATGSAYLRGESGTLLELSSRELVPDWAILDAGLLSTLPVAWIASTAADALAHAFEASLSEWTNPIGGAMARDAIATILRELPKAVRHPELEAPREQLQVAATLAGLAVANSQLGLVHALAHAAQARLDVPHSLLVAALLPYGLEFNFAAGRDRLAALERVLGGGPLQSAHALGERIRLLWESAGLPRTLGSAGVDPDRFAKELENIVSDAARSPALLSNPRVPTTEELRKLLGAAMHGSAVPP